MILFDPITGERRKITYELLEGITGISVKSLRCKKTRKQIIKCINCYLLDDDVTYKELRELMAKVKLEDEIWKEVKDNKGYYISNYGRVKRGDKFLIPTCYNQGRKVKLNNYKVVSRLVAEAFLGNIGNGDVYHKDGNRFNDRVSNLKIVNRAFILDIARKTRRMPIQKIDPVTNMVIEEYKSVKEAAEKNFTTKTNLSYAARGKYKTSIGYVWRYNKDSIEY